MALSRSASKLGGLAGKWICSVCIACFTLLGMASFYNMTGMGRLIFNQNNTGVINIQNSQVTFRPGTTTTNQGHRLIVNDLDIVHGPRAEEFKRKANDNFSCVNARYERVTFPICLYESKDDAVISKTVRQSGQMFELGDLRLFLRHMTSGMGLIDVGANLGTYTLPAAHLGYPVVAVEMTPRTAIRLRQSVLQGKVAEKVKLIHAAASNKYTEYHIGYDSRNRGDAYYVSKAECDNMRKGGNRLVRCDPEVTIPTILLDDLVDVVGFKTGAMKIDAQGAEVFVFQNASRLFQTVDIKFVLLEWVLFGEELKKVRSASTRMSEREMLIHNMVDFFLSRNYKPYTTSLKDLSNTPRKSWSYNVIFKKS